ncbi:MAG: transporter related protein [Solirubrobacterales bacterium]|nr:transporter related protein [Solirubrobacterales bacterium]
MTTATESVLEVSDLTLRFGNVTAFEHVSFTLARKEILAVIGPNGAGKSSLINALSRVYSPTGGSASFEGRDLLGGRVSQLAGRGVARTFQNLGLFGGLTVADNVMLGRHRLMRSGPIRAAAWFGTTRREEREHHAAALRALEFVGAGDVADTHVGTLSYGLQKRVELARALAMEPRLLLLDEPVAGMNRSERAQIAELVERIHVESPMSLLLVEHDMETVMRLADRVMVMDFGRVIAIGSPEEIQRDERVIRAYLGSDAEVTA